MTVSQLPTRFETERLYLRCYEPGDGAWYFAMSRRNRLHLARYEAGNSAMSLQCEQAAESLMRQFAVDWTERRAFFLGAFERTSDAFVAQIYVGPTDWTLPEFNIGYFADCEHEGRGYVTEAVRVIVRFLFDSMDAHRIHAECDDTNVRSARVLERCGFLREGHFRENKKHPDATLSGTLHYGLLKGDLQRP